MMTKHTLEEICSLTGFSKRTVRFYIQKELADRPNGAGRGSHYTELHLKQFSNIKKWTDAGLSLERIRELQYEDAAHDTLNTVSPKAGSVQAVSHIHISDGVELYISPSRAGLSSQQVRDLAKAITEHLTSEGNDEK